MRRNASLLTPAAFVAAVAVILVATTAGASTITVTNLDLQTVAVGGSEYDSAFATDTWLVMNLRSGSSAGITGDYAQSGNGSVYFEGADGGTSKGDIEYYFSSATGHTLGNLTSLSYDWYRDAASSNNDVQIPALRLMVDADGNAGTTNDRGYLIYERVYNTAGAAPEGSWQTASMVIPGTSTPADNTGGTNFWWYQAGVGVNEVFSRNITDWINGEHTTGFATLSADSVVYGISSGIGSGWGPYFEGAVDNISIGFGGEITTWNFELAAVPEPTSMALLGLGLAGLAARSYKKRSKVS